MSAAAALRLLLGDEVEEERRERARAERDFEQRGFLHARATGALPALVAVLADDLGEVEEHAVAALHNLALFPPNRLPLVQHGALERLLQLASPLRGGGDAASSAGDAEVTAACRRNRISTAADASCRRALALASSRPSAWTEGGGGE